MRLEVLRAHPALLLTVHAASLWPVGSWYVSRMTDGSDEPWGVVALLAAWLLTWPAAGTMETKPTDPLLLAAAVLTLIYAALWTFAPRLICAAVAITALACSWVSLIGARSKLPAVVVLFVLSLPVLASLQFYLGYPLRATTAAGATWLLHVIGFDVERSGAVMRWQEHVVLVDAPCSGVRMLWAAAFLSCILAMQRRFVRWPAMIGLLLLAVPIVLVANMVRAAALFTFEIQPQPASAVLHALIGVSAFGLTAVAIVAVDRMLRRTPARVRVSR